MDPLSLDSPRWTELRAAYGSAGAVPPALRTLGGALRAGDPKAAQVFARFAYGDLLHQGTTYPATAAALPHIVHLAESTSFSDRSWLTTVIAAVACGIPSHAFPADLREPYDDALRRARSWIAEAAVQFVVQPEFDAAYALSAVAALHALWGWADVLKNVLLSTEALVACPSCRHESCVAKDSERVYVLGDVERTLEAVDATPRLAAMSDADAWRSLASPTRESAADYLAAIAMARGEIQIAACVLALDARWPCETCGTELSVSGWDGRHEEPTWE